MQAGQQGGQQAGGQRGRGGEAGMEGIRAEQSALQQGLQALGRNLSEAGQRSAMVNRDVGAALGRAMLSMQQTLDAMERQEGAGRGMPTEEAAQSVEALNRLALELLQNSEQIAQAQTGTGLQQALEQLAQLAKQQGSLNGQMNSLLPLGLAPNALSEQLQRLAQEQRQIAKKLGGVYNGGEQESLLGRVEQLAQEADEIARDLDDGRLTPDVLARQERLFHRLLDAGRTLEREEVSDQRVAERPGNVAPSLAGSLDPTLIDGGPRFPVPGPEALRGLRPAYRRLILEYFDRLNRSAAEAGRGADSNGGAQGRPQPDAAQERGR